MDRSAFPFRDLQGRTRKLRTPKTARTGPERAEPTETGRNQVVGFREARVDVIVDPLLLKHKVYEKLLSNSW